MGDRAYTRFSFPAHLLTPASTQAICHIFGLVLQDLNVLQGSPDPSEGGFANEVAFRLVQGCPCLVIEDDEANHGGYEEEEALVKTGVPFLRENYGGANYGPGRTVYDGLESMSIPLNHDGNPFVGVRIDPAGWVAVNEEEMDDLRQFVAMSMQLLKTN